MQYFDQYPVYRQWPLGSRRMHLAGEPLVDHDTPVVHFGSCFGENIQLFLDMYHFNLLETQAGYKYSCHSILREVRNAFEGRLTKLDQIYPGIKGYTDLNHHRIFDQDQEQCQRKINAIERNVQTALSQAEVVILTPSVNEVWFNRRTQDYILHPYPGALGADDDLHVHSMTTHENLVQLEQTREILLQYNPNMQIIIGVCPISLRLTYQEMDAVQGNNISKFTIYAAVNEFCQAHANVHYFPGFDIVFSELAGKGHYREDNRHLTQPAVRHYLRRFGSMFFSPRARRIAALLEQYAASPERERWTCLENLADLGYDPDLIAIKAANTHLLAGQTKEAFDRLCRVSVIPESPALGLNLGLLLLDLGLPSKAAPFLKRSVDLLGDLPGLAFGMADRAHRKSLGDNHMRECGNTSDQRLGALGRMLKLATAALETLPVGLKPGLRSLQFMDILDRTLFPVGMSQPGAASESPPRVAAHPALFSHAPETAAFDHCGDLPAALGALARQEG
ncbi:GSCFA domain-containing protein [Solidesulfovibrio magneticus]|uniref:GSCFA domain-containing protein n=1 Tax=Solidesulfovibrio magneticus (strain ATCC 700980 / DSM 13731 / RS-1) TaxID=573370 RepID=C4XP38_SOLM1|nr:GSCFA domain-containing protein [Solidesulfovibrio magneticus]BAH77539.1 hypothetical protein DMR_40480 [Solidesulfovibrio magneticus RS-1]